MSENEKLRQALEEHKRRHPDNEEETIVALGRVLYPKEDQPRGSHALKEEERQKREVEAEEMAKVREVIAHLGDNGVTNINADVSELQSTKEPYESREQKANKKIKGATGILAEIRARRTFASTFEEKEGKK